MRRNILIGSILVIIFCLMLYSTISFIIPYKSVSEIMHDPDQYMNRSVQVIGNIMSETFAPSNAGYEFMLTDGNASMDVIYHGRLPGAFDVNAEVIVIGRLTESGVFNATKLIAPYPSRLRSYHIK